MAHTSSSPPPPGPAEKRSSRRASASKQGADTGPKPSGSHGGEGGTDARSRRSRRTEDAAAGVFGFTKILSLSSLALILATGLILTVVISNSAREMLLEKQEQFATLLAENLNHQIYRRFILPTLIGFGSIELSKEAQYDRLERVIESSVKGLNIRSLRIYDTDGVVSFATNPEDVGEGALADKAIQDVIETMEKRFVISSTVSPIWGIFNLNLEPDAVMLRMVYPLRTEDDLVGEEREKGPLVGVLEIHQDIAADYETVLRFQRVTLAATMMSSLGLFVMLLAIIRKVDRINAERIKERERLERELHQNEKLVSMGRMVAGVAHEIRNPLGIIRSSAELLLARTPQEERQGLQGRILKAIDDEAKRLSRTVNDFLDYARPRELKRQPVDLSEVVDQVTTFLEPELARLGVSVVKKAGEGLVVHGDKDLLHRAILNVVTNAMQAMADEEHGAIAIRMERAGAAVRLAVQDSGPGFALDAMEKYTDPFFTTKDNGTGLGLPIIKNIVESHGGSLTLANAPGQTPGDETPGGALVVLELPAA